MFAILDLDGTIIDTTNVDALRAKKDWRGCVARCDSTSLFGNIRDVIATIRKNDVPVGIVTNSVSYYAMALLQHHHIQYDSLICYHDTLQHKPHPEPVLAAMRKMGFVDPSGWGIGDHSFDCEAYSRAGISAAGAGWNPNLCRDANWNKVLRTPSGMLELFDLQ